MKATIDRLSPKNSIRVAILKLSFSMTYNAPPPLIKIVIRIAKSSIDKYFPFTKHVNVMFNVNTFLDICKTISFFTDIPLTLTVFPELP